MRTDLKVFAGTTPTLDPAHWAPDGVTDADLVCQRVLYALGTPQGSVPGSPKFGTPFAQLAAGFRTELELFAAYHGSDPALRVSVRACEAAADPATAKLGDVRLDGVTVGGGAVSLALSVATAAGAVRRVTYSYEV